MNLEDGIMTMSVDDDRGRAVQIYAWTQRNFCMRLAVSRLDRKQIVPPQPGLGIQEPSRTIGCNNDGYDDKTDKMSPTLPPW